VPPDLNWIFRRQPSLGGGFALVREVFVLVLGVGEQPGTLEHEDAMGAVADADLLCESSRVGRDQQAAFPEALAEGIAAEGQGMAVDALHGAEVSAHANEPYEVRVRVAGRTENLREAIRIGNEVETLYTNGPAAGGGVFKSARDVVAVASVLLPRELARPQVRFVGV